MKAKLVQTVATVALALGTLTIAAPAEAATTRSLEGRYWCTDVQVAKFGLRGYLFLVYNQGRFTVRHDSVDSWLARHATAYGPIRIIDRCAR